jgi:hypothetical protein
LNKEHADPKAEKCLKGLKRGYAAAFIAHAQPGSKAFQAFFSLWISILFVQFNDKEIQKQYFSS